MNEFESYWVEMLKSKELTALREIEDLAPGFSGVAKALAKNAWLAAIYLAETEVNKLRPE